MDINNLGYIFNTEGLSSFNHGNSTVTYLINDGVVDLKDFFLIRNGNSFYEEFVNLILEIFTQLDPIEVNFSILPQDIEHLTLEDILLNSNFLLLNLSENGFSVVRKPEIIGVVDESL